MFFSTLAFSQEVPNEKTWAVKLNLPQLVDVITFPNVAVSVEKRIKPYLSVIAEFGYQFYDGTRVPDTTFFKQKGFKTNLELRFYPVRAFRPHWQGIGWFVGLQGFYRWNQYNASTAYEPLGQEYDPERETPYLEYYDNFGVRKKAWGCNFVAGYQHTFFKRFLMEPYIGIGYLKRDIKNYYRTYDALTQQENNGPHDFFSTDLEEDSGSFENFILGFRIGYKF